MKMVRIADTQDLPAVLKYPSSLESRFDSLWPDMVRRLERTMTQDNYGVAFLLLGWEHLATCLASHYFIEVLHFQAPCRWPYALLWLVQGLMVPLTIRLVRTYSPEEYSPLGPTLSRVLQIFMILCGNVVVLNGVAGHPVFTFLPVWATLSSFTFLVLATLFTRRFAVAALVMFATGGIMAHYPAYGFLIYGVAWLLILETIGVYFCMRRRCWQSR